MKLLPGIKWKHPNEANQPWVLFCAPAWRAAPALWSPVPPPPADCSVDAGSSVPPGQTDTQASEDTSQSLLHWALTPALWGYCLLVSISMGTWLSRCHVMVVVVAFSLYVRILRKYFWWIILRLCFFFFFYIGDQLLCTISTFLKLGSVHSSSVSWDDCSWAFQDWLRASSFPC